MNRDLFTALDLAAADADLIQLSVDDMLRSGRRRRLATRTAGATAAMAVVGAAAAGASLLPATGMRTSPSAVSGTAVDRAAIAASVAACSAAPFWYTRSQYREGGTVVSRQIWLGQDGHTRLADTDKPQTWDSPMQWVVGSWSDLCTLTTDVPTLYSTLRRDAGDSGADKESETFDEVGDLLRESPTPLAVRLALLDVAARVPGAEVSRGGHDSLGRVVTKVSRVQGDNQGRVTYLIDPETGQLREENDGGWINTYLASGPVPDTTTTLMSTTDGMVDPTTGNLMKEHAG